MQILILRNLHRVVFLALTHPNCASCIPRASAPPLMPATKYSTGTRPWLSCVSARGRRPCKPALMIPSPVVRASFRLSVAYYFGSNMNQTSRADAIMYTYKGSCHCGLVQFEVRKETPIDTLIECNCSICTKKGILQALLQTR